MLSFQSQVNLKKSSKNKSHWKLDKNPRYTLRNLNAESWQADTSIRGTFIWIKSCRPVFAYGPLSHRKSTPKNLPRREIPDPIDLGMQMRKTFIENGSKHRHWIVSLLSCKIVSDNLTNNGEEQASRDLVRCFAYVSEYGHVFYRIRGWNNLESLQWQTGASNSIEESRDSASQALLISRCER